MKNLFILLFIICIHVASNRVKSIEPRVDNSACDTTHVGNKKIVCKCSETSCHDLEFDWPTLSKSVIRVQSSQNGSRFESVPNDQIANNLNSNEEHNIEINLGALRQTIMGYGGAFTDATGWQLANLSSAMADKLIASYYGATGLRYTYGRVPLGGSDFSTRAYTYDDIPTDQTDYNLDHFKIQSEDYELKVPYIMKAKSLVESLGDRLRLFSSPWSPPAWMKTNKKLVQGKLLDQPQIYETYANYWLKFLESYRKLGIEFWGATIQNEPYSPLIPVYDFNSLLFGEDQMSKFVSQYLGPKLHERNYTKDNFKLMIGDDSVAWLRGPMTRMLNNPDVAKYISGVAYHWYMSGLIVPYSDISTIYNDIKDKIEFLLMTEACEGSFPFSRGVDFGEWSRAEAYAKDIIEDLQRFTNGWIDWNMALDQEGSPNWAENFVDSPIIVDTSKNIFYKQPMYYALSHFTRFVVPGSVIVESKCKERRPSDLNFIASHKKDTNHLVVVIMNSSSKSRTINLSLQDGTRLATSNLEPRSISSVVVKL